MPRPTFIPLEFHRYPEPEMQRRASELLALMQRRRTVRQFSDRPIPRGIVEDCLRTAGTAPSGANLQPWHFVVVTDSAIKRRIREEAEREERAFYAHRAPAEWLEALAALGTDAEKPFLETAPALIVIFGQTYGVTPSGRKVKNYYVQESVGIATGLLITAIHHAGLVSLTHTPSPMGFLAEVLGRPPNERAFLILVVGYPTDDAVVPAIERKPVADVTTFV